MSAYSYSPGQNVSAEATAPVTANRLVKISGNRTAGGNLAVSTAAAGDRAFGVASEDTAVGQLVHVARGGIIRVVAAGAIAAGAPVSAAANGAVATAGAGITVIGLAVTGAVDTALAEIAFYA